MRAPNRPAAGGKKEFMKLLDFLRFHFIETLMGGALLGMGLYNALNYVAPSADLPFGSPIPFEGIYWGAAVGGALILIRARYVWNKTRVR